MAATGAGDPLSRGRLSLTTEIGFRTESKLINVRLFTENGLGGRVTISYKPNGAILLATTINGETNEKSDSPGDVGHRGGARLQGLNLGL